MQYQLKFDPFLSFTLKANCFKKKLSVSLTQTTRTEIHQEMPQLCTGEYKLFIFALCFFLCSDMCSEHVNILC